jgi:DnaJ-class molecular chaperone
MLDVTNEEIRQIYRQRRKDRLSLDGEDRDTLLPCPSCTGSGLIREPVGSTTGYKQFLCPYCDGWGVTDQYMIKMYRQHCLS